MFTQVQQRAAEAAADVENLLPTAHLGRPANTPAQPPGRAGKIANRAVGLLRMVPVAPADIAAERLGHLGVAGIETLQDPIEIGHRPFANFEGRLLARSWMEDYHIIMVEANPMTAPCAAPPADRFPTYPAAWYLFGDSREMHRRPVSKDLLGRRLVAFRTAGGEVAVLDSRCSHLRADLGNGCVVNDTIQCPYHHWRYDRTGRCVDIPAGVAIPEFARQASYPAQERHGLVFFFHGPRALYPLPFFADADPGDFIRARPFGMTLHCPWWLVGANACDLQHFLGSHDRKLAGPPTVENPTPYSRRARAPFAVVGTSWRDRLTELVRRRSGGAGHHRLGAAP